MAFDPGDRPTNCQEIFYQIIAINPSLQILNEHLKSSIPIVHSLTNENRSLLNSTTSNSQISSDFVKHCCQELTEFIGPMASIVCQRIIKQNPNISQQELCIALAKKIDNPEHAKIFQRRLFHI
jgi:eukaryotic-like serine/threonine-protein kinase